VSVNGNAAAGAVTSDPAGLDCPGTCTATFADGAEVTLTSTADPAGGRVTWAGCDPPAGDSCVVRLDADRTVTAHFGS
jgi:hypothetical protein